MTNSYASIDSPKRYYGGKKLNSHRQVSFVDEVMPTNYQKRKSRVPLFFSNLHVPNQKFKEKIQKFAALKNRLIFFFWEQEYWGHTRSARINYSMQDLIGPKQICRSGRLNCFLNRLIDRHTFSTKCFV